MEPQKQVVIFLAEFDYQVEQIESILRKILNQKDTVIKDLKIFRKTITGFIEEKP